MSSLQKSLFTIIVVTTFASCSSFKNEVVERKIASNEEKFDYVTKDERFWSPTKDYTNSERAKINDKIRNEFEISEYQTILKGKASVNHNKIPRVFSCEAKIFDFSKSSEAEDKIVIMLEVKNHQGEVLRQFSKSFSTSEDLKSIKKVRTFPEASRVVLYRPYGAPNLTVDLKMFKGRDESFINIVTNTPITLDKAGVTCEF